MIKTRKDLKEYLAADLVWYYELKNTKSKIFKLSMILEGVTDLGSGK